MKALISILIVLAVIYTGFKVWKYVEKISNEKDAQARAEAPQQIDPTLLNGMDPELELPLLQAYRAGPRSLKAWIDEHRKSRKLKDPRLAWIELDYVVKITSEDPVEARRIFAEVKRRTPPESPVYGRVKSLEKTYE